MNHFVFEKTMDEASKKVEQEETVDYFKYQQEYRKRLELFMVEYGITIDKLDQGEIMPFYVHIE